MSEDNKDDLVSQFMAVTAVDSERARFYLDLSAWQLELALASFYETGGDAGVEENNPQFESRSNPQFQNNQRFGNLQAYTNDDDDIEVLGDVPPPQASKPIVDADKSKPKPKQKKNSRFATLSSLNNEVSSEEEDGQAFYAGGSEHSGQQVLGPSKKKKDFVSEMFRSVQEHGAELVDPSSSGSGRGPSNFVGTGYRLGQSANDTEVVSAAPSRKDSHKDVVLKMFKEGFTVDEGTLRLYNDPINREFMDNVARGEVPDELLREFKSHGAEVHLNIEDHRHEQYVATKPKAKAFVGQGFLLGSPAPAAVGTTNVVDEKDKAANEKAAQDHVNVDESAPVTNVMIRFPDRTQVRAKFNQSHTVANIREFISIARPQFNLQPFLVSTTYPNKELDNYTQTLAEAGILNAALNARFV